MVETISNWHLVFVYARRIYNSVSKWCLSSKNALLAIQHCMRFEKFGSKFAGYVIASPQHFSELSIIFQCFELARPTYHHDGVWQPEQGCRRRRRPKGGHKASTCILMSSITSNPLREPLLPMPSFSPGTPFIESKRTDASHP
ncbi:hypothetical protein Mapa_012531 [Marchantia paleacea]|nr:hypothetical protein Mapa_012531 [Marchantia paleacea]